MAKNLRARPEVIRALRERDGDSRAALAARAGIDRATLKRIEDGTSTGRPTTLETLAAALGVDLSVIATGVAAEVAA